MSVIITPTSKPCPKKRGFSFLGADHVTHQIGSNPFPARHTHTSPIFWEEAGTRGPYFNVVSRFTRPDPLVWGQRAHGARGVKQTVSNLHAYKVVKLAVVQPYEGNPRTHSDEQVEQLRRSIREFGFTNPLLLDEQDCLIAGHGRLLAAEAEGLTELPAIVVAGLSDTQRRALVIADNRLALDAGWNQELLTAELRALQDASFDVSLVGFSGKEIDDLLGTDTPDAIEDGGIEYQEKFSVLIECDNEQHQKRTYDRLVEQGFTCKVLVN